MLASLQKCKLFRLAGARLARLQDTCLLEHEPAFHRALTEEREKPPALTVRSGFERFLHVPFYGQRPFPSSPQGFL